MVSFIVIIWIATGVTTLDAIRRPAVAWVTADRHRTFWVSALVISSLMLLPAFIFVPGYLFGVMPLMGGGQHRTSPRPRNNGATRPAPGGSVDEFRRR